MDLKTFTSHEEFIKSATQFIADVILATQETAHISLSGGSTPKPAYKALSERSDLPFNNVSFYQVDERYVPKNHEDSNYKMIYESLIQNIDTDFHYFDTSLEIDELLKKYAKEIPTFDLTILGMGTDGHFASLFPNSPALNEKEDKVAHTTTEEHAIKDRLTLTIPPILNSKKILLLLSGANKQEILDDLMNSSKSINKLPAKALLSHLDFTVYFYTAP